MCNLHKTSIDIQLTIQGFVNLLHLFPFYFHVQPLKKGNIENIPNKVYTYLCAGFPDFFSLSFLTLLVMSLIFSFIVV